MENLKAKLKKQGGFTMVELLIVVAIIAILVAVSIPMMNQALERSRHAVDQANVRDAISLASVEYLSNPESITTATTFTYYVDDNSQGRLYSADEISDGSLTKVGAAVNPACTCNHVGANSPLTVTVTPVIGSEPTVETSWHFDKDNQYTTDGTTTP